MKEITLHQARMGFQLRNKTENKSSKTVEWYDSHIERLESFLRNRTVDATGALDDPTLSSIDTDVIREFIAYLQGKQTQYENHPKLKPVAKPLSPYTIRGIVATLSAFFGWAHLENLIAHDPMDKIKRPKVPKKIKARFTDEEIEKLIAACDEYSDSLAIRNEALLRFLLDSAVRASELCTLVIDRVDLERGRAHVTGKGSKDRYVYFGNKTKHVLWKYITVYRPSSQSTCVFLTHAGKPLNIFRLAAILTDIAERAGVEHCNPHKFRHTAARLMSRNGLDAFMIQKILGHETLETSRIYVELEREDVERAFNRASPMDRLAN